jgi:hypothetical protein
MPLLPALEMWSRNVVTLRPSLKRSRRLRGRQIDRCHRGSFSARLLPHDPVEHTSCEQAAASAGEILVVSHAAMRSMSLICRPSRRGRAGASGGVGVAAFRAGIDAHEPPCGSRIYALSPA